jgi:ribosomal protein S18 acetylase RimI-like enzyme
LVTDALTLRPLNEKAVTQMNIRSFRASDLPNLIDHTIEVFGPFYERSFRSMVPADVYMHHHGSWADDYRTSVPQLHDPSAGKVVAIAPSDGDGDGILGFVAWEIEAEIRHGTIAMVAVRESARGAGLGRALCEHALASMQGEGVEFLSVGTGGDWFHAPARALYESLGFHAVPVVYYLRAM